MRAPRRRRSRLWLSAAATRWPPRRGPWSKPARPARRRRSVFPGARPTMPDFAYVGLDTAGRERRGSVRAETSEAARDRLVSRRLYVVRIEPAAEAAAPLLSRGLFARRKISVKQLTLFTRQLATLIQVTPLE